MLGPVEYLSATFQEEKFRGEMAHALADLVDRRIIHIIDLVFIHKDAAGVVAVTELEDLDPETARAFSAVGGESGGLLSEEDIALAATDLAARTGNVLVVWENVWEKEFFEAIGRAGGSVAADLHIGVDDAEQAYSALPPV